MRIEEAFPKLPQALLIAMTRQLVEQRDGVAAIMKSLKNARLGFALTACEMSLAHFASIERTEGFEWLQFRRGPGLSYLVYVNQVPMRIQPDCPEIRDVMPAEKEALAKLFGKDWGEPLILRLEVSQKAGRPVRSIDLYLFDQQAGTTHDVWHLYDSKRGYAEEVATMKRPAETPALHNLFRFPPANDVEDKG